MIKLTIPGFGPLEIRRVVTDYTGTHSFKGVVRRSVKTRLAQLAKLGSTFSPLTRLVQFAGNWRDYLSNSTF